jgi:thymidylate synthase
MVEIWSNSGQNYQDLLLSIRDEGFRTAPRGLEVHELINENLYINNNEVLMHVPGLRDITDPNTKEGQYLRAEFVWYMSGMLDTYFISQFGKMWERLGNDFGENDAMNGEINSNYGYHVFHRPVNEGNLHAMESNNYKTLDQLTSFEWVINELKNDLDSRKAIIHYTWPVIYRRGVKDFTCTQTQHFLVREGNLYNLVHIRSSDAIKGLTFDIPWWDFVGQKLAQLLDVNYNSLQINIGSSHYYSTDNDLVDKLIELDNLEFNMLLLRDEKEAVDRLHDTANYIRSISTHLATIDRLLDMSKHFTWNSYYFAMQLCGCYLSSLDLFRSKDVMIDLNNRIFDSIFTY